MSSKQGSALTLLAARLPDGAEFLAALSRPTNRAVRLHPRRLHAGRESAVLGQITPVPWADTGRFTAADADPGDTLAYHTGAAYPQDAASQVPVLLLAPEPGEVIIDICAAPGSKSTQIGLALHRDGRDDGLLICCDESDQRRRILAENLARQGVASALVTPLPVHRLAVRAPGSADGVLVDAPCSGHQDRSVKQVARMALRQGELLTLAAKLVRPGGRLVYSTCTPYGEENEGVIETFCATHPGWQVEAQTLCGIDSDLAGLGGVRLWPQRQGSEPFFAIRMRCPGDASRSDALVGNAPEQEALPWLPNATAWRRGNALFLGSAQVAACALPSEARGLIIAHGDKLEPWGAQGLIERGAPVGETDHATAVRLWAGESLTTPLEGHSLLRTSDGLPLGQLTPDGLRLAFPSRLFRAGLR